jgi:phosphoribosyl 1,2-cyclic phosphate phosphodiesterase
MPTDDAPALTVTLLGTGTSTGVPVIGCTCRVCQSDDPRDTRTRCACHVRVEAPDGGPGLGIQIDTGPDFRQQALREDLRRLDAVCFTHHHFDHVAGLDDLRPFLFRQRAPLPCYGTEETTRTLAHRHAYIFGDDPYPGAPPLDLRPVEDAFCVASRYGDDAPPVTVTPVPLWHGDLRTYGYRIGRFAYLTDANRVPDASRALLDDLDVLVLDALRPKPHPTHFAFDEAVAVARDLGARQTYFIHMTHNVMHAEQNARFPSGVALGHDGLTFSVE